MAVSNDDQKKVLEIFDKSQKDPDFKKKLLSNPQEVLEPYSISFLKNAEVKIFENTKNEFHIVVPINPLPEHARVDKLPPNPTLPKVTAWIVTQIQKNTPLKEKLLSDPKAVLAENKIEVPQGLKVIIHSNSDKVRHFILPQVVSEDEELSATELELVAGGKSTGKGEALAENATTNANVDDNAINTGTNYGIVDPSPMGGMDIEN